ncbi:MAG: calcium/sodium antiporter [Clostridia bacterium]|nr:calcium/sodium antiporter [Clostridia bacterium]
MTNFIYDLIFGLPSVWTYIVAAVLIVAGFFMLIKGADEFVDSSAHLAKLLKIPAVIVGFTIVAFGTSAPELSVSISATSSGSAGIAVGDIVGSNVFNLLFILGLTSVLRPVLLDRIIVKRDILVMLVSSYILLLSVFVFGNGSNALMWFEGLVLLVIFIVYIVLMLKYEMKYQTTILPSKKKKRKKKQDKEKGFILTLVIFVLSLIIIIVGGSVLTASAKTIAVKLGVSEVLAGLTICAIGSSLPDLITSLNAIKKNESEIAIGNIVGSNIFNTMCILSICSFISPITIDLFAIIDIVAMVVMFTAFFIYSMIKDKIDKKAGIAMVCSYILYFVFIILRECFWF